MGKKKESTALFLYGVITIRAIAWIRCSLRLFYALLSPEHIIHV